MIMLYSLLFLVLAVACQSQEICDFESNLCQWSNIHPCKFTHIMNTPLVGETGYLMLSKDTCKKAAVAYRKIYYIHFFQMDYFINGTGHASITVIAEYVMAGPRHVWTCRTQQGPEWNHAQIFIKDALFDQLRSIVIEAVVEGDATVAIGNISPAVNVTRETSCPSNPATKKLNITRKIGKMSKTAESLPAILTAVEALKNKNIVGASLGTKDFNSTLITKNMAGVENAAKFSDTTFKFPTSRSPLSATKKTTILNRNTVKLNSDKRNIPYEFLERSGSKQTQNDSGFLNIITAINALPTSLDDLLTDKASQSDSKIKWSVVIGCSLFAIIVLILLFMFGIIMYKRKIEILNVYEVDGKSLLNFLYS